MRGALDQVALVEIIGPHPAAQELLHEHLHYVGVVVHAAQQDRLIPQRNTRIGETAERLAHLDGEFPWMIDMDAHPKRVKFLQHRAKLGGNPLRKEDGDAAADAQELNVLDGAQAAEQVVEPLVREQESVAARKQDIAHLGMFLKIIDGAVKIEFQFLLADAAHDATARAITAIGGAAVRDEKKHAIGVAMHQSWHRHVVVFAAGIGHVFRRVGHLLDTRNHLPTNRAFGVEGINEIEEVGRDAHGQFRVGQQHAGMLLVSELNFALEVIEGLDAVAHLPLPVVPLRGSGIRPKTLAGRRKLTMSEINGVHENGKTAAATGRRRGENAVVIL